MLFNVDVGEGIGQDAELMPYVQLCNVSCGAHAGTPEQISATIQLAKKMKVKVGAHPGYPDPKNFGRVAMEMSPQELRKSLIHQLESFLGICTAHDVELSHLKPHGALYHQVAHQAEVSEVFFGVLKELQLSVPVIGLGNTLFEQNSQKFGFDFMPEAFADRKYLSTGMLMDRNQPGAVLDTQQQVNQQLLLLINQQKAWTIEGQLIPVRFDTICFHGDHAGSVELLKGVHRFLNTGN